MDVTVFMWPPCTIHSRYTPDLRRYTPGSGVRVCDCACDVSLHYDWCRWAAPRNGRATDDVCHPQNTDDECRRQKPLHTAPRPSALAIWFCLRAESSLWSQCWEAYLCLGQAVLPGQSPAPRPAWQAPAAQQSNSKKSRPTQDTVQRAARISAVEDEAAGAAGVAAGPGGPEPEAERFRCVLPTDSLPVRRPGAGGDGPSDVGQESQIPRRDVPGLLHPRHDGRVVQCCLGAGAASCGDKATRTGVSPCCLNAVRGCRASSRFFCRSSSTSTMRGRNIRWKASLLLTSRFRLSTLVSWAAASPDSAADGDFHA